MSTRNLEKLFNPSSVAVIGASNRSGSVGAVVMRNLLAGGFQGPIMPVNPNHQAVAGVLAYPSVESLPITPEMAIICTPPPSVPKLIDDLGCKGNHAVICLTAGLRSANDEATGRRVIDLVEEKARALDIRILGPNCVGALVPRIRLNASFAHLSAKLGQIAFVSQSGAMCTVVLDWARTHDVGFSHFISLGDKLDVDFGDVIDYLGTDPGTRAILLYIESVRDGRKFVSACRAASRNKPVIVIKSGREAEGARAAASHTGALAGRDEVYETVIRRAGMLRVRNIPELFSAVETIARAKPLTGEKLAIMTNGGGIGVMAVDDLINLDGALAELSPDTLSALDRVLPANWSEANPVDIIGDAPGKRYSDAAEILSRAPEVDALLVMHAPVATASTTEAARAVIDASKQTNCNLLTSWVGGEAVAPARRMFTNAGVPTFETPSHAVGAFMHMVHHRRNKKMLMETPPSAPEEFTPDSDAASKIVQRALVRGNGMMTEPESKALLAAYGIPTVETHIAEDPDSAAESGKIIGFPVVIKILSEDISHKSDVGGVVLNLKSAGAVREAAEHMLSLVEERKPDAKVQGFSVQKMANRPGSHELIIGVISDPVFGPVILFGQGGIEVEVVKDSAMALPPLNMNLARDLIERTRISKLLAGYRNRPAVDMDQLCLTLLQVSQLVVDIPEIFELDINPLWSDENGVLAVDARIRVEANPNGKRRLAIRPYPKELEESFEMRSGRQALLRPIRPEDEPRHHEFIARLSPQDIRFRFFGALKSLPHSEMAKLTQIDYDREMAFIATGEDEHGRLETLGVVRTVTDANNHTAEYAVVVRSDLKGERLGWKLLTKMIEYCQDRGTRHFMGEVLTINRNMLGMAEAMGFTLRPVPGDNSIRKVTLDLGTYSRMSHRKR
ncbi:MAG: bifunctional acetate--CoA ligase family protein/GNAT family N-acetyltransferase [Gammaproteobacteria bacterium]|nr:bifunctional acetate--CoA ligase family protein/GNAT family N-acetyltransferase [Gammaproteobacteria bacterium]